MIIVTHRKGTLSGIMLIVILTIIIIMVILVHFKENCITLCVEQKQLQGWHANSNFE